MKSIYWIIAGIISIILIAVLVAAETTLPLVATVFPGAYNYSRLITEFNCTMSDETGLSQCWWWDNKLDIEERFTNDNNWSLKTGVFFLNTSDNTYQLNQTYGTNYVSLSLFNGTALDYENYTIEADVYTGSSSGGAWGVVGLSLRANKTYATNSIVEMECDTVNGRLEIRRGTTSYIFNNSAPCKCAFNNWYKLKAEVDGARVKGYLNGTLCLNNASVITGAVAGSDKTVGAWGYYINNGSKVTNITVINRDIIPCGNNVTGITFNEGSNNWTCYAEDTSGNMNSSSVNFISNSTQCFVPNAPEDWIINWNSNCLINQDTDIVSGDLILNGTDTGTFTLKSNLTAERRVLNPATGAKFILDGGRLILKK